MKKLIIGIEGNNKAFEEGFRFKVNGNYRVLDTIDPWSGMPDLAHDTFAFDNEEEAREYAKTQIFPFTKKPVEVWKLEHRETPRETQKRLEREKAEREAKKLANDKAKAEKLGLTLEEFKERRKKLARAKGLETEVERMEKEIERLKKEIARKRKEAEKIRKEYE